MEYLKSALPSAYNNARQALGKEAGKAEIPWGELDLVPII